MSDFDPTEARRQRGLVIAAMTKIEKRKDWLWAVPSQSGSGKYWVRVEGETATCTCPDYEERGQPCKHVFAVRFVIERQLHPDGSETVTESVTVTRQTCAERKTYRQDWPAYNAAQTTEKARFQSLLHELCSGLPEPERDPSRRGRKPLPLGDRAFSAAFKVYSTFSGRRFQTDLDDAHARGHLSRPVRYNTVFEHFADDALTPALRSLIAQSCLPLASVEIEFAVDSSGFTSSRYVRWFDHKYGVPKHEYDWVKCHLICGVRTNIVTAVDIGEKHSADSPQFRPLLSQTSRHFAVDEVSADAAYLSYENMEAVARTGGTPFIAFKANSIGAKGGTFGRMYHMYNLNRDAYLAHYHKRSNVESTFSMIKAKFGDHLRSRSGAAMVNEALCKVLCHNLCCLIQSQFELGIEAKFYQDEQSITEPAPSAPADGDFIEALAWV